MQPALPPRPTAAAVQYERRRAFPKLLIALLTLVVFAGIPAYLILGEVLHGAVYPNARIVVALCGPVAIAGFGSTYVNAWRLAAGMAFAIERYEPQSVRERRLYPFLALLLFALIFGPVATLLAVYWV